MNFSKKNHQIVGQNDEQVKKSQKHDVNVQKNGTLYFQVGLALMLLVTYTMFEMRFKTPVVKVDDSARVLENDVFVMKDVDYVIEENIVKEKQPPKKKVLLTKDPIVVDNKVAIDDALNNVITELPTIGTDAPAIDVGDIDDVITIDEPVSFIGIEKAPVYPGCEKYGTERERKQCMSSKINKLISRKLNPDRLASAGVLGRQTVFVEFTIDKQGMVSDIKTMTRAKSHADDLKKEALRVTKKIPQMKPGKQSNKVVPVRFTLPITVDIKD